LNTSKSGSIEPASSRLDHRRCRRCAERHSDRHADQDEDVRGVEDAIPRCADSEVNPPGPSCNPRKMPALTAKCWPAFDHRGSYPLTPDGARPVARAIFDGPYDPVAFAATLEVHARASLVPGSSTHKRGEAKTDRTGRLEVAQRHRQAQGDQSSHPTRRSRPPKWRNSAISAILSGLQRGTHTGRTKDPALVAFA